MLLQFSLLGLWACIGIATVLALWLENRRRYPRNPQKGPF